MFVTKVLKTKHKRSIRLTLACIVIVLLCASLNAQVNYLEMYEFNCNTGGCNPFPVGVLTRWTDGNLYGTTSAGSFFGTGTAFSATPQAPTVYQDLIAFSGMPFSGWVLAYDGNLYGATTSGGANGYGSLFQYIPPYTLNWLHDFTATESIAETPPVSGKDGNLYGVTALGHTYTVTIAPTPTYTALSGMTPGECLGGLYLASDGNLYGTTEKGGTKSLGAIFKMTTPKGTVSTVHSFKGSDGSYPYSPLVEEAGYLYGTTQDGGLKGGGAVFQYKLKANTTIAIYSFDPAATNGTNPEAGLVPAPGGTSFYGATFMGGLYGWGTLFEITTTGTLSKLYDFGGTGGTVPGSGSTTLMQNTDGKYYAATFTGGAQDDGTLYTLVPVNLSEILTVVGPIFVQPGLPVQILGDNLTDAIQVSFGSVQAQFQANSDSYLTATVPTTALDAPITVTLDTGLQVQTEMSVQILPRILNLDPSSGPVGTQVDVTGGGLAGTTEVTFGGVKATNFTVVNPSLIQATVPTGAKSGYVKVTTPNGTAQSPEKFKVN
jgi:uncharacterized repeat protein (TIGR03803 family)